MCELNVSDESVQGCQCRRYRDGSEQGGTSMAGARGVDDRWLEHRQRVPVERGKQ